MKLFARVFVAFLGVSTAFARPTQEQTPQVPDGLPASDWASIRAVYDANRHATFAVDGGYQARNPSQQWTTHFDGRGFEAKPDGGGWSWGLDLVSWGYPGEDLVVDRVATMRADGQRVTYDRGDGLSEWWVNDQRGLEHGYTVDRRPMPNALAADGQLVLTLAVRGDLRAEVMENGRGVRFANAEGAVTLTYAGLIVLDADGRELPAHIECADRHLRLLVDERAARYPITIDPIAQQAYLKASNTTSGTGFGYSVAVSSDTVVVGSVLENSSATGVNGNQTDLGAIEAGAAYVFVRNGNTWSQQAYLKASNTDAGDQFGFSVAVSDDTIIVGAWQEDSGAMGVGADQTDNSAAGSGAAYVYVRNGTTWSQQAYLKASNCEAGDGFGYSVTVSGDTIVVGAKGERSNSTGVNGNQSNNSLTEAGASYVFVRSGTAWMQQAYLKASNTGSGDRFGYSVAAFGDTAVIGATGEASNSTGVNGNQGNNSAANSGASYIFTRNGTVWSQQAYLKASNATGTFWFGTSVAISGDTIVVGSSNEASNATGVNGNQADTSAPQAGAAYVFVRSGTTWSQQAYLKASNTEKFDQFGESVSIFGDLIAIGAYGEDSNATGLNGNQGNNSAKTSGAAYVFRRSGTVWDQMTYVKASNTGAVDHFGFAVALSDDIMVAGAYDESSDATGVNGDQNDDSSLYSGAAYVFDLDACQSLAIAMPYGSGKPGSLGVPVLSSTNPPLLNSNSDLTLTGGLPSAAPVLLFAGLAPATLSFDGGALLVNPTFIVTLPALDGNGSFVLPIPIGASTCGLHVYFQAMFVDPGAAGYYQTVQTSGLDWTLGT